MFIYSWSPLWQFKLASQQAPVAVQAGLWQFKLASQQEWHRSCGCAVNASAARAKTVCDRLRGERSVLGACVVSAPVSVASCASESDGVWSGASDFCRFYTAQAGVVEISGARWRQAQRGEAAVWDGNAGGEDRNEQHSAWFGHYK